MTINENETRVNVDILIQKFKKRKYLSTMYQPKNTTKKYESKL